MIGVPAQPEGNGASLPIHKLAHPKQQEFLWSVRELGTLKAAQKATGVAPETHYKWLREDGLYADAYAGCRVGRNAKLEETAYGRAIDGVEEVTVTEDANGNRTTKIVRRVDNKMLWNLLVNNHPDYAKSLRGGDQNVVMANLPDVQITIPHNGRD